MSYLDCVLKKEPEMLVAFPDSILLTGRGISAKFYKLIHTKIWIKF